MEPERKIEKVLRAYAKKRRGQARDPFKLDAATRRMFQNEISRDTPAAEDEDDTVSLWEVLRRNWAFLLAFAACIFVVASIFVPTLYAPKNKSILGMPAGNQQMRQMQELAKSSDAGMAHLVTNGVPIAAPEAGPAPSGPLLSQNNLGEVTNLDQAKFKTSQRMPVLLSDNAPTPAPAPVVAPPVPEGANGTRETASSEPPPAGLPPSIATAGASYAAAPMQAADLPQRKAPAGEPGAAFTDRAFGGGQAQNSFMNTMAEAEPSTAVLKNFQVSQNGSTIRVVDQDGSVYTGTLEAEDASAAAATESFAPAANRDNSTKIESPKLEQSDKVDANQAQAPTGGGQFDMNTSQGQKYSFRVGGMNRTLNQSVVFTATLLEDLSAMKNAQVTFGLTANAAVGAAVAQQMMKTVETNHVIQLPWSSFRIAGTAVVNKTNQVQVNALPVTTANSSLPQK